MPTYAVIPRSWHARALLLVLSCAGCAHAALGSRERFDWADQPITFSSPRDGWRREGELSGGRRGIRFVKERSVGEAIGVAEYYLVGDRDRAAELRGLLEKFDTFDERGLRNALNRARWRTDQPFSAGEAQAAAAVNDALDRSLRSFFQGDRDASRRELAGAVSCAERLRFTLQDVVDEVVFRPERRGEPARYHFVRQRDLVVGAEPAIGVEYTFRGPERLYQCREVYVVHANHLFIASYVGLPRNVWLFEQVVASIQFPPSGNVSL